MYPSTYPEHPICVLHIPHVPLLYLQMGVGKTVQGIALASCYDEEWPLLVIVPASLRLMWAEEIEKWMPHLRPSQVRCTLDQPA